MPVSLRLGIAATVVSCARQWTLECRLTTQVIGGTVRNDKPIYSGRLVSRSREMVVVILTTTILPETACRQKLSPIAGELIYQVKQG